MKVAIIGTRGVPNNYGGFEQCAEYLSRGLVKKGFDVTVYNSHNHQFQKDEWQGVKIIHQYDPENKLGCAGQFIYDLNCILDCKKHKYDIILQLGYTSNSIWNKLLPRKNCIITTNMDGLEWKRSKYSKITQAFLLRAEKLAVKSSDYLISDSIGIRDYIKLKYNRESTYIPYGADLFESPDPIVLSDYDVSPYEYLILIARLEPDNSIELILDGYVSSDVNSTFLVIGNHLTNYGNYLKTKFKFCDKIKFLGGIYDMKILNNLRYFSKLYLHGHTVGGTNPSLLEAMASQAPICAHNNVFNRSILHNDALYFTSSNDIAQHIIRTFDNDFNFKIMIDNNVLKIINNYSWDNIVNQYADHFEYIYSSISESSIIPSQNFK